MSDEMGYDDGGHRMWIDACTSALFPHVKTWSIAPKKYGRHEGCVVYAGEDNEDAAYGAHLAERLFIKRQPLCLRTMFVYRVLAHVGCGPQHTLFRAVRNRHKPGASFSHDIATNALVGFRMESTRRYEMEEQCDDACTTFATHKSPDDHTEAGATNKPQRLVPEEAMLLVLLTCLFALRNLPGNAENWGTTADGSRLAIVDFSFGQGHSIGLVSDISREMRFGEVVGQLARVKQEAGTDNESVFAVTRERFRAVYGRWFGSRAAFDALLVCAMDDVSAWVNDDVRQREWRVAIGGAFGSIPLLRDLEQFQELVRRSFGAFASWFCSEGTTTTKKSI